MSEPTGGKRLVRPRKDRMVAGVCSGLGAYFGIDANIIRLGFGALTIFTAGIAALIYVVAWAVVPEEGEDTSIVENLINKNRGV